MVLAIILFATYLPSRASAITNNASASTEATENASVPPEPSVPSATETFEFSDSSDSIPSEPVGWLSIHAATPVGFEGVICVEVQNTATGLLDLIQIDAVTDYICDYKLFTGKYIVTQAYILNSDHFSVQYPEDVLTIGTTETALELTITGDQQLEEELEAILATYEPTIPPEAESSDSQETYSVSQFYFSLDCPDADYVGHAVPELTVSQIERVKNTIYGEAGASFETMLVVAQCIRDSVDRSSYITYDNFVTECQFFGGYEERPASVYNTPQVKQVFDYIFVQGNSAVQHPVYCFYTRTTRLKTDDDYQSLFSLPLEFIIEVENTRFFCWDE